MKTIRKTVLLLIIIYTIILVVNFSSTSLSASEDYTKSHDNANKVIMYRNKIPIEVDYKKGVLVVQGKEIPIIVDSFGEKDSTVKITDPKSKDWVPLDHTYTRFDVYVEPNYYNNNRDELNLFFDRFEPRYELMETLTGWSSEKFYGTKLKIYVEEYNNCWWGYAFGGEAHLFLYEDLSNPNGCNFQYYVDGVPYYNNPGELGDHWWYMTGALHESLHAINPLPVYARGWLTEGWSHYYQYNILSDSMFSDINQETADYYNYHGTPYYNWEGYVSNDYHDTSPDNATIQESAGYDITAWMFSMLRDDYLLPWSNFYTIMNNNPETLDKSLQLGGSGYDSRYTDTHVIDLFERATGTPMYLVFRYDGLSGPGWGVRNWTDLNWYADLAPVLSVSDTIPCVGDSVSLNVTIHNYGGVSLENVSVRYYSNDSLLHQDTVAVGDSSFINLALGYSAPQGVYNIKVVVDEDNLKIETDDSNNADSQTVTFGVVARGDANADEIIDVGDVVYLINYLFKAGPPPHPLCTDCNCDDVVDVGDIVYLINYLFKNGPEPTC